MDHGGRKGNPNPRQSCFSPLFCFPHSPCNSRLSSRPRRRRSRQPTPANRLTPARPRRPRIGVALLARARPPRPPRTTPPRPCRNLRGVVGVDPDVVRGQIAGPYHRLHLVTYGL